MISDNDQADLAALKNQVFTLLVALIVVSGTLMVVLYRQATITGKDIAQGQQMLRVVGTNQGVH